MVTDPIANMICSLKNAILAGHDRVEFPASRLKANICKVLKEEGYIKSFKVIAKEKNDIKIKVLLKDGSIVGLQRVSKPGLRVYSSYDSLPRVLSGLGISVVSTSLGVLSSREAKKKRIGGELLCNVW